MLHSILLQSKGVIGKEEIDACNLLTLLRMPIMSNNFMQKMSKLTTI